ncbi:MAG: bifunctional methylenetetrahydrofolate dehydrogenase/methenyltetrahydrofolate cyclohydrolase FolD [Sebaldella sp.]|nr:bifunctional methylenetetrahydrofolate dehydrogenase/methenyltetrahydrofolate cyclohydrolase FolD [Sebaldella sp.]
MIIIDGKLTSNKIREQIKEKHEKLLLEIGRKAGLAVILVGENAASKIYVKNKAKACEKVGFHSEIHILDENINEIKLLDLIKKLNNDEKIDGILVQLPLPKHINELKVINAVSPAKDVDAFHPLNVGKYVIGDESGFLPCTPYGIIQLLDEYNIDVEGKDTVVVGRSNIVGKPISLLMTQKNATVQICHTKTKKMFEKIEKADIIISAVGIPNLIKAEHVKEGAVVIDVGISRVDGKVCGDIEFEGVSKKASYITPVPGGVGPMTITSLLGNTLKSFENKRKEVGNEG